MCKAIEKAGYRLEEDIVFALDIAASELYNDGQYFLSNDNASSSDDLIDMWEELTKKYPIFSIEDPLHEDDWDGWVNLNERIGKKTQIVGDDLFVTNSERLKIGIEKNAANSILIKVNQIGTITETLETINIAKNNKYSFVISHRSGETEDTFIVALEDRKVFEFQSEIIVRILFDVEDNPLLTPQNLQLNQVLADVEPVIDRIPDRFPVYPLDYIPRKDPNLFPEAARNHPCDLDADLQLGHHGATFNGNRIAHI